MDEKKMQVKKFTQGYTFKMLFLAFLILTLLIPLVMVGALIDERSKTADSAEAEVMEAWGSELVAAGPVIAIPGVRTERVRTTTKDEEKVDIIRKPFTLMITPQKLNIGADFKTETRKRGIFSVPLFYGDLAISGIFDPTQALASLLPNEEVSLDKAELIISLSSQKGIRKIDQAVWSAEGDDVTLFFQPGNRGQDFGGQIKSLDSRHKYSFIRGSESKSARTGGIHAMLPELAADAKANFNIAITIHGGRLVRFLPLGQDTHADITTDWPSPSFQGSFLPSGSNIKDNGFDATWDINYLSRDIPLHWKSESGYRDYSDALFGVNFFRAIDTYSLNTRAVKYAILFLIVPFLTLFLFEVLTKKRIHPVPYLLSGIANIIFYLLLLSLSEQMQFYLAYLISALAIIIMLTLYSRALLPSWNKSWYMGLVTTVSYVLLYAVLNAESYALLVGSVWAFIVVALVMFLTRKLNWYGSDE
ncbi:MAG: cell envelope integrity protein CreD [Fibromonadaceae bacterium]|jgi:inner membrane protein|nr:cell envelope integrity protein CreD [Fibromonadaceae bacterium]